LLFYHGVRDAPRRASLAPLRPRGAFLRRQGIVVVGEPVATTFRQVAGHPAYGI